MDTSPSVEGPAKSTILTQEFLICICRGDATDKILQERRSLSFSIPTTASRLDLWEMVWVSSRQANGHQWFPSNPWSSSRLSASTSMDTTWWPGIMARPSTLGSPWENVSENTHAEKLVLVTWDRSGVNSSSPFQKTGENAQTDRDFTVRSWIK